LTILAGALGAFEQVQCREAQGALNGGNGKVDAKLNNADAATAIGAFLRRLRREGR
jgi:hypothetical protein